MQQRELLLIKSQTGESSAILTELINGESYDIYLRGRFSWIDQESELAHIQVSPRILPPTTCRAETSHMNATIFLTWSCVPHATGYEIERMSCTEDVQSKFIKIATIPSAGTTAYSDESNLVNGNSYKYRIAAIDGRATSDFSSIITATPQFGAPAKFKAVSGLESTSIVLSWTFVENATGYRIERALPINDVMDFTVIQTISNGRTTTYNDKFALINGKTYSYKIAAIKNQFVSAFSPIASATSQLSSPARFQAETGNESRTVILSWATVADATGYEIQRAISNYRTMDFATIATITSAETTSYIDRFNLVNGEDYVYRIAAIDNMSTGAFSTNISATPELPPPRDFKAVLNEETAAVTLLWSSLRDATGYKIFRADKDICTPNFSEIATISDGSIRQYIDRSNLENGKTYQYKIAGIDIRSKCDGWLTVLPIKRFSSIITITLSLLAPDNLKATA
ncbi:unnamed protein product, partial [Adineta ricciae]